MYIDVYIYVYMYMIYPIFNIQVFPIPPTLNIPRPNPRAWDGGDGNEGLVGQGTWACGGWASVLGGLGVLGYYIYILS
jgi:hypothetical protein